ncbi:MAG TPA: DUF5671 domain-containing protein [Actinomycetaceae bacterium]|nr:DUF5671 domain-containing protein [Actinomycetaceae bacterium]
MSAVPGLIGLLVSIGLVVLIVVLIGSRAQSHSPATGAATGAQQVRQFFQHLVLYGLVLVAALGLDGLFVELLGPSGEQLGPGTHLARSLAFTIVGLPLAAALGMLTRRRHRTDPFERQSVMWALHVTAGAITGLIGTMVALHNLFTMVLGVGEFDAASLTSLLVWGGLWGLYWVLSKRALSPGQSQPHVLLGSLIGLLTAVSGFVSLLSLSIDTVLLPSIALAGADDFIRAGAVFVTGSLTWIWYWGLNGLGSKRGILWHVLVLPIGVGGGLMMAVISASIAVWRVATWLVGDRLGETPADHFSGIGSTIAVGVAGLLVWLYHRSVLAGAEKERTEVHRVHEYLVSAIGLAAAAYGVGTLIVALIETVTPGVDLGISDLNTLLGAITLLAVGAPLWVYHWDRCQKAAAADPVAELNSPTRRIYLMASFGLAGVAAVIALLVVVYVLFVDVVDGSVSAGTVRSMRYGLGVLAATAAVSAYHGVVQRADRATGVIAARRAQRRRTVVLIGAADDELAKLITDEKTTALEAWQSTTEAAPWDHEAVLEVLHTHPEQNLVVLGAPDGGFYVIPVTRGSVMKN